MDVNLIEELDKTLHGFEALHGLTSEEASKRLKKYGYNEVKGEEKGIR